MRESTPYVGRFAPSPTGPLHLGSLVAAVASYLQARVNRGRWLVRIEDIDPPREQGGATELILEALQCYGFEWDGEVIYQSASRSEHETALSTLIGQKLAYRCTCSRSDLADLPQGPLGVIYPGYCRDRSVTGDAASRVRTEAVSVAFTDGLQGEFTQDLASESGDFVIRRRDGLIAYQLAVVVDDEIEGITEIVRGIDLIDSTPRQIWLQQQLGYRTPNYVHIPVITHPNGDKLSKATGAPAIPLDSVVETLIEALTLLRQDPPPELSRKSVKDIWLWSFENWQIGKLYGVKSIVKTALT